MANFRCIIGPTGEAMKKIVLCAMLTTAVAGWIFSATTDAPKRPKILELAWLRDLATALRELPSCSRNWLPWVFAAF